MSVSKATSLTSEDEQTFFRASKINTSWVALMDSRGIESYEHKLFMRYTVIIADLIVFIPAIVMFVFKLQRLSGTMFSKCTFVAIHLLYPGLILIDHGHFQYNCISLGLFLWAVVFILAGEDLLGSFLFVLALNYKQMELYHALPFFCYLLGSAFTKNGLILGVGKVAKLGTVVIGTFVVIWWPFLNDHKLTIQVIHRLFPFARGIYEDKVANFWCSTSVLLKWNNIFTREDMVRLCGLVTMLMVLPSCVMLTWKPSKQQFKLALFNCSLTFFLFSFQVHEKSILLTAVLYPLMVKDQLMLAFYALTIFYYFWLCDIFHLDKFVEIIKKTGKRKVILFHTTTVFGTLLCIISHVIRPPEKLPDLFAVLISIFCFINFLVFLVYFSLKQFYSFKNVGAKFKKT